ncbi:MAG: MOSC domain-containing protein [Rhodospirillaceae bacterium]|nr:MOSC domain-containing protein [Rhodospirillaceae bacterium]
MRAVTRLYRYPVKGLSPEPVDSAVLSAAHGFPMNRRWALALADTPFDPAAPVAQPKTRFLMLQRDEALATLATRYDDASGTLFIRRAGRLLLAAKLDEPAGRAAVEDFFHRFMGERARGRPRLVSAPGFQFTDISVVSTAKMRAVSLINLASLRALEQAAGAAMHPLRFRANIYFEGARAWEEHDWMDREIAIGGARAVVCRRTTRCAATQVNPETGERDRNPPKALQDAFGHGDLGVYAEIVADGSVRPGDPVGPAEG